MSALKELAGLWKWWLPPILFFVVLTGVVLVWLGLIDVPIAYEIL